MNLLRRVVDYVLGRESYHNLPENFKVESVGPYVGPVAPKGTAVRVTCGNGTRVIVSLAPELINRGPRSELED